MSPTQTKGTFRISPSFPSSPPPLVHVKSAPFKAPNQKPAWLGFAPLSYAVVERTQSEFRLDTSLLTSSP